MGIDAAGFRHDLRDSERFLQDLRKVSPELQAFDADAVIGKLHLISAWERAQRAFKEGRASCSRIELETLCYAAGERQISVAIGLVGVNDSTKRIALLGPAEAIKRAEKELSLQRDDSALEPSAEKLKRLGIESEDMVFELMSMREVDG
ncbi:MAG: hypothetical protein HZB92_08030 [Euryarchaeota archaeon]|nr:hypothetical protein [Euryarchaeota archaeon]